MVKKSIEKRGPVQPAYETRAFIMMLNALGVITKDRMVLAWLKKNDPMALRQCRRAIAAAKAQMARKRRRR